MRIYTTRPGKLNAFVKLYQDYAWALQQKHLGQCLGWYTAAEGPLNQVVHLWAYSDQGDRERRRAAWRRTQPGASTFGDPRKRATFWRRRTGS